MPLPSLLTAPDFDLALTVASGQFFLYLRRPHGFLLTDRARSVLVSQSGDTLSLSGAPSRARRLLGLDSDHDAALRVLERDPLTAPLLPRYRGLRVMRQDPWQCLVCFVCSANSNVARVCRNAESLTRLLGNGARFPGPQPVPPGALASVRLGYRQPYVEALFNSVAESDLAALANRPFGDAIETLVELPGVGVKVAECVAAFALGFGEACPVDVWIRRVGKRFLVGRRATDRRIAEAMRARFGRHTALAQQMLFCAARDGVLAL
jgi:N-glycosylase/DNA lyase